MATALRFPHVQPVSARKLRARRALSLIELLVVVAVIAILLAILIPAVGKVRESARAAACLVNLRTIGMGFQLYANGNRDFAPPRFVQGAGQNPAPNWPGLPGYPFWASAYWSDQDVLGQYAGSTTGNAAQLEPYVNGVVARRSSFVCPADYYRTLLDNQTVNPSYAIGFNFTRVAPDQNHPAGAYCNMWHISANPAPAKELVVVDGFASFFTPGGWMPPYPFYGNDEPLTNGNYAQDGQPNSVYNWARRHSKGTNALFLDGHASWFSDLKPAYDQKIIDFHMINE